MSNLQPNCCLEFEFRKERLNDGITHHQPNFYQSRFTLIPAWIGNYIPIKCGMKILTNFQKTDRPAVEVW